MNIKKDKSSMFWKIYFKILSIPRYLLKYIFKFYPFNLIPTQSKQYCIDIICHLNKREIKESVVEIGCGLGDILRNINFKEKYGYDKQMEVLNALNFLNKFYSKKKRIKLSQLQFGKGSIQGKHDAIILVNWIHKVPNDILQNSLKDFYRNNLNPGGEIIIDSISGGKDVYPYQHDFKKINEYLSCDMKLIGNYSMGKNQDIIRKTVSFIKN